LLAGSLHGIRCDRVGRFGPLVLNRSPHEHLVRLLLGQDWPTSP